MLSGGLSTASSRYPNNQQYVYIKISNILPI
nr:MAG TPA: hypothetical protein [Caudoviricetes sp.]DAZ75277.1 MAG TPA: hypothetical protein [Caudoviricetes sp.]